MQSKPLPGPSGLTHVRYAHAFVCNPYDTLLALYRNYGPAFRFGSWPFQMVYLLGPEANQLILTDHTGLFQWREAYKILIPIGGEAALILSDGDEHQCRRRIVQPAFHKSSIESYFSRIVAFTNNVVDEWRPGQIFDAYRALRILVLRIVTTSLFGANLDRGLSPVVDNLEEMLRFVNLWPWLQLHISVPGTPWHRFKRARAAVDALVYSEIHRRRESALKADDLLSVLILASKTGGALTDQHVRDLVVSLITAAFDTTSAILGWLVYVLLSRPDILERARSECTRVVNSSLLTSHHLTELTFLNWVIAEGLRLYSPAFIGVRKAVRAFEFSGYRVPVNSIVAYSQYVTHRLPDIWTEPGVFLPDRWNPHSMNYQPPTPYGYVPFGGGGRRCIGETLALMELKVILCQLLRRTCLSLISEKVTAVGMSAMHPKEGVWVRVDQVRDVS
jgi:cytochrome P450